MKFFLLIFLFASHLIATDFTCANPRAFTPVYSADDYSKLVLIGNNSLCMNNNGICGDPGDQANNNINMMHNDVDDDPLTTLNSSAALLDIPENKRVLWAGLFWQGYMLDWSDADKEAGHTIKYKHENDAYQVELNAQMNWVYFNASRFYYQSFVEITDYVNRFGRGYYWVGDIATTEGQPGGGSFGAWSLAVVYEDYDEDFNNITVFHGYQSFAGTNDINNAISYANAHGCNATNTGVGSGVASTLTGFLTPKNNPVQSTLIVFAGEGDIRLSGDTGSITDISGTKHALTNDLNPQNNIMNATISQDGETVTTGKPYIAPNSLGIDIDTYDVSDIIENNQSSTNIEFTSSGDGYMPGMYGLQTQLYVPKFCYDYAYKQNNRFFTEQNSGDFKPHIRGHVVSGVPVEVSLYIKNKEASDVKAINTTINILDINSSQANYSAGSTGVTYPGAQQTTPITDAPGTTTTQIVDIPIGEVYGQEYFYTYYDIIPLTETLLMPINAEFSYDLVLATGQKHYTSQLNDKIPICSDSNFKYIPAYGAFNIVQSDIYSNNGYYNIPTQVTQRADNFMLVAHDYNRSNPSTIHDEKAVTTMVAVELIDAGKYHDINASCNEPDNAISPRIWVTLNNTSQTPFSKTTLDNAIINQRTSDAILSGTTPISSAEQFYVNARENTAFRITYNAVDNEGSLVALEVSNLADGTPRFNIANFSQALKSSTCLHDVDGNNNTTDTVAQMCTLPGTPTSNAMTESELAACMECVYGYHVRYVCSRDNFATRPEAFLLKINDRNQSNPTQTLRIADDHSGTTVPPNTARVSLAAGYKYQLEINATNHISNTGSPGYVRDFKFGGRDYNLSLIWEPSDTTVNIQCNDTRSYRQSPNLIDGYDATTLGLSQAGEYRLNIIDNSWTRVDFDPMFMTHHTGAYFFPGSDCVINDSIVPEVPLATPTFQTNGNTSVMTDISGCTIDSDHKHSNTLVAPQNSYYYKDYNLTFKPYRIHLGNVRPSIGMAKDNFDGAAHAVYMSDLNQIWEANNSTDDYMAVAFIGTIEAVGADDLRLSNYVNGCYAQDLNISALSSYAIAPADGANDTDADGTTYTDAKPANDLNLTRYIRIQDTNTSTLLWNSVPVADITTSQDDNLSKTIFFKNMKGQADIGYFINYNRQVQQPAGGPPFMSANNPVIKTFHDLNITCSDTRSGRCAISADLRVRDYNGTQDLNDTNVTFVYGRTYTPRVSTQTNVAAFDINYEIFCDACDTNTALLNLLNAALDTAVSPYASGWRTNRSHAIATDGTITDAITEDRVTRHVTGAFNPTAFAQGKQPATATYDAQASYPYKTRMSYTPSSWLYFDKYNPLGNQSSFPVEFLGAPGQWVGQGVKKAGKTDSNASASSSRRLQW